MFSIPSLNIQPQGEPSICWSNPICTGLLGCWELWQGVGGLSTRIINLVNNCPAVIGGTSNTIWSRALSSSGKIISNGYIQTNASGVIDCGNINLSSSPQMTVIVIASPTSQAKNYVVVSKINRSVANSESWQIGYGMSGAFSWGVADSAGTLTSVTTSATYATNKTYHIAGVVDGANMLFYVNGVSAITPTAKTSIKIQAEPVRIGNRKLNGSISESFEGVIGQVLLFKRALSQVEIQSLYTRPYQIYQPISYLIGYTIAGLPIYASIGGNVKQIDSAYTLIGGVVKPITSFNNLIGGVVK